MKLQYYGTKLSENISRRDPEGYLLCLNVPVARTGYQEYWPEELGLAPSKPGLVSVFRPESEVFAPEALASFEGMPVTDGHPPDGVDVRNIRHLQMGHAHHIRRGAGEESDLLLADLMITDPRLIDAVLAGKREISCGYNYELHEENGQYIQRKIRGNHIAVVDAGRAGSRVSIRDARSEGSSFVPVNQTTERSKPNMKKALIKMLARMAKDGDAETVAEFIEAMAGEAAEAQEAPAAAAGAPAETPPEEAVQVEVPENREITIDENALTSLLQRLDRLAALLESLLSPAEPAADELPVEEIVEEVLEAAKEEKEEAAEAAEEIAGMVESVMEPDASVTIDQQEDCGSPDPAAAKDALRAVLQTFRPVLAKMSPRERSRACADIAARLRSGRKASDAGVYASLASARKAPGNLNDLGRRIMAARNPNYKQ